MFIDFNMMGETFEVIFTVYLGNKPIEKFSMAGPRPMLEAQFMSFVQQIANQKQPMKVVMERTETIWDRSSRSGVNCLCQLSSRTMNLEIGQK